jgi:hypothetical protein
MAEVEGCSFQVLGSCHVRPPAVGAPAGAGWEAFGAGAEVVDGACDETNWGEARRAARATGARSVLMTRGV